MHMEVLQGKEDFQNLSASFMVQRLAQLERLLCKNS